MKEFKGTKGPWEVVGAGFNDEGTYYTLNIDLISKDNANLIAAAPDLLEELQLTLGALREICFTCGAARPESTIRRAEAAIAKALGE
jgi:hypothetical protein